MTGELKPLELDWYASGLNNAFAHDSWYSIDRSKYYFDKENKFAVSDNDISLEYLYEELDDDQDPLEYVEGHPERFIKIDILGHIGRHELLKKYLENAPEIVRDCYHNSIGGWLDCIEEKGEGRDSWKFAFEEYVEGVCRENAKDFFARHGFQLVLTE